MSKGCDLLNEFLKKLTKSIKIRSEDIALVATFGSRNEKFFLQRSDLDIIIILDETPKVQPINRKSYGLLLSLINEIRSGYEGSIMIVPTIGLEDHALFFGIKQTKRKVELIHLLVYPSVGYLLEWEIPSLIKGICQSANIIYGNHKILNAIRTRVTKKIFFENIYSYTLRDLTKANIYVQCTDLPEELLKDYGIHYLKYCLKYISAALFLEMGENEKDIKTWPDVLEFAKKSKISHYELLEEIGNIDANKTYADLNYIRSLFDRALEYLNLCYKRYKSINHKKCVG